MRRVDLSDAEIERFSVSAGDLLFARRSLVAEGAGKCCVVLHVNEPTTFESSIIRARPDPTRSASLYWYYFFCSPSGLHSLDTIRRQVAVAGITGRDLSKLEIAEPSLAEQRVIAHVLGTLDDKIELNQRMNGTLEAMARALFRSWFVDYDPVRAKMAVRDTGLPKEITDLFPNRLVASESGEIPEGWELSEIGREVNAVGGSTPSTKEPAYWVDGNQHWATPKDLSRLASPVLLNTDRKLTDGWSSGDQLWAPPGRHSAVVIACSDWLLGDCGSANRHKPRLHRSGLQEAPPESVRAVLVQRERRPHQTYLRRFHIRRNKQEGIPTHSRRGPTRAGSHSLPGSSPPLSTNVSSRTSRNPLR